MNILNSLVLVMGKIWALCISKITVFLTFQNNRMVRFLTYFGLIGLNVILNFLVFLKILDSKPVLVPLGAKLINKTPS